MSSLEPPPQLAPSRRFFLPHAHPSSSLVPLFLTPSTPRPQSPLTSALVKSPVTQPLSKVDPHSQLQPCLLLVCVVCNQSSAYFSPLAPPLPNRLTSSSLSTQSNHSSNPINTHGSSSSLNRSCSHSTQPSTFSSFGPAEQELPLLEPNHPSTASSSTSPKTSQKNPPVWVSGQIHAICSSCHHLARLPSSRLYQSSDQQLDMPSHPAHLHPVSLYSDITPLSPSSTSSGSLPSPISLPSPSSLPSPTSRLNLSPHPADVEDGTSSSESSSSSQSGSVASAKLFRLSFIEPSEKCADPKLETSLAPQHHDSLRVPNLRTPSTDVIRLELPPRRKVRRVVSPAYPSEPKEPLATVVESPTPNRFPAGNSPQNGGQALPTQSADIFSSVSSRPGTVTVSPASTSIGTDRGASLRSLLRQAKIPPPNSDHSSTVHQGHLRNASEIWEAALVGTPREPRGMQPPSWQTYLHTRSEERVYHRHRRNPSNSSNISSFQSHPLMRSNTNQSLRARTEGSIDNHAPSQTCSLRLACADRLPVTHDETAGLAGNLGRRPSLSTADSDFNPSAHLYRQPQASESSHPDRCPQRTSPLANQAITDPHVPPLARQSSSHGLFGRFMGNARKDFIRRPNTATGFSTHFTSASASAKVTRPLDRPTLDPIPTPTPTPHPTTPTTARPTPVPRVIALASPLNGSNKRPSTSVPHTHNSVPAFNINAQRPMTALASPCAPQYGSWPRTEAKVKVSAERPKPVSRRLSKSVPVTPTTGVFETAAPLPTLISGTFPLPLADQNSRLPPEDFHSKSRNLTIAIHPRPSSDTFRPGQRLMLFVRRNGASARRKYGTMGVVLSGVLVERRSGTSHEFLRVVRPLVTAGAGVGGRLVEGGGDEWAVELMIPEYATCGCQPGPLALPSAGMNAFGEVSYTIQLFAEKKQFLSSHETITVKFHLTESIDRRIGGHLTTRPSSVRSSKGRIVFAAGHLGSIEDYSLSHSIYFFHPERVEIFYAFEVRFGPHSNLPTHLIDQLAASARVELRRLVGEDKGLLKGVVERRAPGWSAIDNGWMISGSLEVTDMAALTSPVSPMIPKLRQRERERIETSIKITNQLFLLVNVEDGFGEAGVLGGKKLELSGAIGPALVSQCALRTLGLRIGREVKSANA
ncbi:hypothetical protein CROQUDRAFT_89813 [Cronartium quercuum f. sp. fusiforme G11]|uniref:Uncharacterized protein n=1 Tax=Cronartium quercuum f. sp. fusiforme G11 TaxID=708437 RepID=A0A9P6NNH2_9BASI|nr:hypothetical protein CROQUDRAFT_89813 [Cronartium quercuum f. sp. fusiforme G11]